MSERDFILIGPRLCQMRGHDWRLIGGRKAYCSEDGCGCSIPVHECTRCGDCDYGENDEAVSIMARCNEGFPT